LAQGLISAVEGQFGLPGARSLQNLHPLVIHYPVAFLTGAVLLYFIAWAMRRESWAWTGLWLLGLGTLAAAVAVYTGLRADDGVMIAPSVREHILYYHKRYMLAAFTLSVVLSTWALIAPPLPMRGRWAFLLLLLMLAGLITKGADYGGSMVYGYNAGGSLPQPIEFSQ
jgi:uncharacterized membrane protein